MSAFALGFGAALLLNSLYLVYLFVRRVFHAGMSFDVDL